MAKIENAPDGEKTSSDGTEKLPVDNNKWMLVSRIAAYIRTLAQTLTNKTIDLTSNTLTGTKAQFNTAASDGDFAFIDYVEGSSVSIASAATVNIGTALSQNVTITGTTTITSFGTIAAGVVRRGLIGGTMILTYNATTLKLPGTANISATAGDAFYAMSSGSGNWVVEFYQKADGTPIVGSVSVSDTAYDATDWDGVTTVAPSKNAVRDKIESLTVGSSDSFKTIAVSGQSDVVADSSTDTLTLVAGTNITLTTNAGTDAITITASGGGSGALVQRKGNQTGGTISCSTALPYDDTIPQITEGDQVLSQAFVPTDAANILWIDVTVFGSVSGADYMIAALFQDSTANALAADAMYVDTGTAVGIVHFRHKMTAGTAGTTTFTVRAGRPGGASFLLNGRTSDGRKFGGVAVSSISIDEVTP